MKVDPQHELCANKAVGLRWLKVEAQCHPCLARYGRRTRVTADGQAASTIVSSPTVDIATADTAVVARQQNGGQICRPFVIRIHTD